jgi:AcrR family transcriptional regulator
MDTKGNITRKQIKDEARRLFAKNGLKSITMKDICEATGLSRGGLYRHFDSTRQIFEELILDIISDSKDEFTIKIAQNVSAVTILDEVLEHLRKDMLDSEHSLSLAIYEYSSIYDQKFFQENNKKAIDKWNALIEYGINRGDFRKVNVRQITDMILYSYQGIRMWSHVIPMDEKTVDNIISLVKEILEVEPYGRND